jgi:hypothetical protein
MQRIGGWLKEEADSPSAISNATISQNQSLHGTLNVGLHIVWQHAALFYHDLSWRLLLFSFPLVLCLLGKTSGYTF